MIDFRPTHYMRLISRHNMVNVGVVEYRITEQGLEDPECTIVPIMLLYQNLNNEVIIQFDDMLYEARVIIWGIKGHAVLHLPLDAVPLE